MNKQELKEKIRGAVQANPFREEIRKVSLFGSYAYGVPRPDSDVDMLIEFTPVNTVGIFAFLGIKRDLESRLHMKVDLVTPDALNKHIRTDVLDKSEVVYEGKQ